MAERNVIRHLADLTVNVHVKQAVRSGVSLVQGAVQSLGTAFTAHIASIASSSVLGHIRTAAPFSADPTSGALAIANATASAAGALSAADKTKIDQIAIAVAKVLTITGTVTITPTTDGVTLTVPASGTALLRNPMPTPGRVLYAADGNTASASPDLFYDPVNRLFGFGTNAPTQGAHFKATNPYGMVILLDFPYNGDGFGQFGFGAGAFGQTWAIGAVGPTYAYGDVGQNMMFVSQVQNKAGVAQNKTVMGFSDDRAVLIGKVAGSATEFSLDVANFINSDAHLRVANVQVVGAGKTGWNAPSGTLLRGTFNSGTATAAQTAQTLAALITDLRSHGLIKT